MGYWIFVWFDWLFFLDGWKEWLRFLDPFLLQCLKKKEKHVFVLFLFLNFAHQTSYGTVLQHDKAGPHAAHTTTQFLANNNVQNSPLAFHVPRFKPKQTHLDRLGETCSRQSERPKANVRELFQALKQESVAIPALVIHNLIQSMPVRCWAVIDSGGEHTPSW